MRADRLISILMLLQTRGRITSLQLALELEVSPRTILRDIEALSIAGVPILTVRGPRGGVELLDGFRTDLSGLTRAEAEMLPLAGLSTVAEAIDTYGVASSARRKLLFALAPEHRALAEALGDWLHIDVPKAPAAGPPRRRLPRLAAAVRRRRAARIATADAPARQVSPLGLICTVRGWQLVASFAGQPEAIEVERITELCVLRQTFERPAGFDLRAAWEAIRDDG